MPILHEAGLNAGMEPGAEETYGWKAEEVIPPGPVEDPIPKAVGRDWLRRARVVLVFMVTMLPSA